jgi:hypothetical protein
LAITANSIAKTIERNAEVRGFVQFLGGFIQDSTAEQCQP